MMSTKDNIGDTIYTLGLTLGLVGYYFMTTMFRTNYQNFFNTLITFSVILLLGKMLFFSDVNLRELIIFGILFLVFVIVFIHTGDKKLLFLLVYIYSSKGVDLKKILKVYCYTIFICTLVTIVAALIGKIPNLIYFRNGIKRSAYGSIYPTNFAAHIFYMILAYVALKNGKLNIFEKLVVPILAYIIMIKCDARLDGYLLYMLTIILIFVDFAINIVKRLGNTIIPVFMGMLISLSIIFSYNYNPNTKWGYLLNSIFNNRLSQGNLAFMRYPVELFGQKIPMQGLGDLSGMYRAYREYFYIDNSYMQILMISGVITFIIVISVYLYTLIDYTNKGYYFLVIAYVFFGISSIIDEQFLMISYNIFLLSLLADKKKFMLKVDTEGKS